MVAVKIGLNFSILSVRVFASSLVDGLKSTLLAIYDHQTKTYTYKKLFTASPVIILPKDFLNRTRFGPPTFISNGVKLLKLTQTLSPLIHSFVRSAIKRGC
jgi:hypothetical protein